MTVVSLPYGFTLFSNRIRFAFTINRFHYLMDLHYSQTPITLAKSTASFTTLWIYTILKRHWCLNLQSPSFTTLWIYTILKQHRSTFQPDWVSLPYGFTLFSNTSRSTMWTLPVSLPYGFTLFSNYPLILTG